MKPWLMSDQLAVSDATRLAYVTQTTLSVDDAEKVVSALRQHFPDIVGPKRDDICYATQNRQDAVRTLVNTCDLILVVGSSTSSNSNRLREAAESRGVPAYLVDRADQIQAEWLSGVRRAGLTAGASAPELLVQEVILRLSALGAEDVLELSGIDESVNFPLPKELAPAS